ncbi:MAG: hypothetical protein IPI35_05430 [Deltaproteobacteria bacterium]|nr:hypothetical protein [Deltaproteobacteria bacterium]
MKDLQHLLPSSWTGVNESPIQASPLGSRPAPSAALEPIASDSPNPVTQMGTPTPTATTDSPTTDNSQDFTASRTTDGTGTTQVRTRGGARRPTPPPSPRPQIPAACSSPRPPCPRPPRAAVGRAC